MFQSYAYIEALIGLLQGVYSLDCRKGMGFDCRDELSQTHRHLIFIL